MATVRKRPLSSTELADAERLNAAWKAYKVRRQAEGENPTQEWLGSETGLGNQSLMGQYLRGLIPLNLKALVAICRAIGAEPSDISPTLAAPLREVLQSPSNGHTPPMGGRSSNEAQAYNRPSSGENFEAGPDMLPRKYPEISWVQAGMWTEIYENFAPDDAEEWHSCPYDLGARGYVVRVKGNSMTAPPESRHTFPEGTLLFVNPDLEAVPGKFVIATRNDGKEATFKKLISVEGELYLEALNPSWPHRYQPVTAGYQIGGVVVFVGQRL